MHQSETSKRKIKLTFAANEGKPVSCQLAFAFQSDDQWAASSEKSIKQFKAFHVLLTIDAK